MHLHDRCICLYDLYRVLGYRYSQFTLLDPTLENCRVASGGVKKGKVFPYSLPSVGPGADPGVQAVSPQVT